LASKPARRCQAETQHTQNDLHFSDLCENIYLMYSNCILAWEEVSGLLLMELF